MTLCSLVSRTPTDKETLFLMSIDNSGPLYFSFLIIRDVLAIRVSNHHLLAPTNIQS